MKLQYKMATIKGFDVSKADYRASAKKRRAEIVRTLKGSGLLGVVIAPTEIPYSNTDLPLEAFSQLEVALEVFDFALPLAISGELPEDIQKRLYSHIQALEPEKYSPETREASLRTIANLLRRSTRTIYEHFLTPEGKAAGSEPLNC